MKPLIQSPHRWSISVEDLPVEFKKDTSCFQQCLPEIIGIGHSNIFQLENDLSYIETHYTPTRDLAILSHLDLHEPRMVVTLGLAGKSCFKDKKGSEVLFEERFTTITSFSSSCGERQYAADRHITQLRFSITKNWLARYLGEQNCHRWFDKQTTLQIRHQATSPLSILAAQQLLSCDVASEFRPLFMHAQAMTILATELSELSEEKSKSGMRLNQKDRQMAQAAHNILVSEYKNPPSLKILAVRVGTNQFKLKQLFHHCFNTTPYGLVLNIRMTTAYQLLQKQRCHVSVAADYVGYQHPNNFSTAFIKYFGVSPKSIAKK